ncbi:hypothetical protein TrispH2_009965 [Trichoplax sp. H2]|nr:hypothetical protein TrispH2_009965 [Trichoplax sp. H2]|eukprot:RDD38330.1 hypothetical protein TrispH2_009965 [Trichoplax sp. H2]
MEKVFVILAILGAISFLSGSLSFFVIGVHPSNGTISAMTFTTPVLPAISIFSVITALLTYNQKPNATLLASIMALSVWSIALSTVNIITYCYIFISNNYFNTAPQCILFIVNIATALGISGLSCLSVNRYYKSLSACNDYERCSGWVRYYWTDEFCCTGSNQYYGSVGQGQVIASITLLVSSIVGLFGENSVFPMLFILAGTCLLTAGILGIITSKLQLPDAGIWFLTFSRAGGCGCWVSVMCNVIFIVHAKEYSRWNTATSLVIFAFTAISSIAGFFLSVSVEVIIGSRLGMHKYDPVKNGEPWQGYSQALKTKQFVLCFILTLCGCIFIAITFLTAILLHAAPFVLFTSLTSYFLIAAGRTAGNILKRKNVSIHSCYLVLCSMSSFCLAANFVLSIHQLLLWILIDKSPHKSPAFMIIDLVNIGVSLFCLFATLYSVYIYGNEVTKDVLTEEADAASEVRKGLL